MSYGHLNTYERGRIQAYCKIGYSCRKISKELGRHHSTITRELKRNGLTLYQSELSQQAYERRRELSKPNGKYNEELVKIIEEKLSETWSPEQISNTVTLGRISFKTIYNWLYQGKLQNGDLKTLRQRGKRRKPAEKRGKLTVGTAN